MLLSMWFITGLLHGRGILFLGSRGAGICSLKQRLKVLSCFFARKFIYRLINAFHLDLFPIHPFEDLADPIGPEASAKAVDNGVP
jgi:hypothetical protein